LGRLPANFVVELLMRLRLLLLVVLRLPRLLVVLRLRRLLVS